MPYLIDGHNLIPKLGLQLSSMDDEQELIAALQEFCRLKRTQVEVYFDGAPAGTLTFQKYGAVSAHFIRAISSADAAIENRLSKLGKQAKGWTVVSSDGRVQTAGRAVHARILASEEFATMVRAEAGKTATKPDQALDQKEVDKWLEEFSRHK